MGRVTMTEGYSRCTQVPGSQVDIRSSSSEAVHGEESILPLMICLLLLSVLSIVLSVMTAISNCPRSPRRLLTG
ncbi:hypothetical protein BDV41DRAFT_406836 [Aspergillus transmontanensis]|uniref:Uncharacterized protein n=1 Tax=Aspergillus transmontanensis TaxID=1034304 RepID=A0A5N6VNC5_9EURO|nr:hypothetical protein BDV41DRAFT_406836 [Aspergillus transmontanensis]